MSTKMSEIGQSNKAEVLSGYLMERLTQLLRDIVDVVEDAVSEYREETLRTRLENESLRRQLGEFLRPPDELWARPQPPSKPGEVAPRIVGACSRWGRVRVCQRFGDSPRFKCNLKLLYFPSFIQELLFGDRLISPIGS